tara:strand:+ start:575 stop:754 length:180 start_codon:yes stop_codon:yes gene_type:complete
MEEKYNINEILQAVNEINSREKNNTEIKIKKSIKNINSDIPKNTLKLIEEAEKLKNKKN